MKPILFMLVPALALAGCAAPKLRTYVLTGPVSAAARPSIETVSTTVIEVRPVLLPDHLDSRDILRRVGTNELSASRNGRWGDRLSVGIRQAIAADLQARLPQASVVTTSPIQPDFRRLNLTITSFEPDQAGTLALDASWSIETTRPPAVMARRRAHLVVGGVAENSQAQVSAMSRLLDRLASAIVPELQ
ncbi:MAG: PqiC family protein [Janthinobacterium lividum]